jgi:membrane protease YdiL (CAAX protease family)
MEDATPHNEQRSRWARWVADPWQRQVLVPLRRVEAASLSEQAQRQGAWDRKTTAVCVVAAINLTLLQYFGLSDRASWLPEALHSLGLDSLADRLTDIIVVGPHARLASLIYWVAACFLLYFVIPALVVRLGFRQRLSEYGLGLRGAFSHLKIYVLLFAIVFPVVILASAGDAFQRQYPFYKDYSNHIPPGFPIWECGYAMQFFALEFFFRGFMVHGLKHRFGAYAVLAMMVPYCMIHFGKPFPETLGAIVAGLVLGFLSLKTGSIWLGFLIHVSVALSMDMAALWRQGLLF